MRDLLVPELAEAQQWNYGQPFAAMQPALVVCDARALRSKTQRLP
ncbi:hypothetical protein [Phaeobacter sp. HS012]|nr:hypothetical protein [Phaeobacter sp. HS012]